jgi:hypothetical protein
VVAIDYKGHRDVHVPPGCNPNGPRHNTWPKGQKWRRSTKTDFGRLIVLTIAIDSG